jgi:hypothetical protein
MVLAIRQIVLKGRASERALPVAHHARHRCDELNKQLDEQLSLALK